MHHRFPVSVKGVVLTPDRRVVLLKNERDEWELPGGKLERGEAPDRCVARELEEELAISVRVGPLIDSWLYEVLPGEEVLIVTYGCYPAPFAALTHSAEHKEVGAFAPEAVRSLPMPDGYKQSIERWIAWEDARSPGFPGLVT
ncbi:MAG TPA: NUDIX domain-containing protein [Longimicrobium sp.]